MSDQPEVTTDDRVDHAMLNILKSIAVEMGYVGENDRAFLGIIRSELRKELNSLSSALYDFFEKYPFDPHAYQTEEVADAQE